MVTVIHKDIDYYYLDIEDWIRCGITTDAVRLLADTWLNEVNLDSSATRWYCLHKICNNRNYRAFRIKTTDRNINQLNKW